MKNPSHEGFEFVRPMLDHFEVTGPDGTHSCLVYEPMRELLWQFQQRLPDNRIPPGLLKVYVEFLLQGLDYLHSECHVIHTGELEAIKLIFASMKAHSIKDIKADNILLGFKNMSVIEEVFQRQAEHHMPRKIKDGRAIYLSHNNFGPLKSYLMLPKIADFGLTHLGGGEEPLSHPFQPSLYHAPEVLLGTQWTYSADI